MACGILGFPGGSVVKNLPANAGDARDMGSIPRLGRSPGRVNDNPFEYFLPGKFHGHSSLVGHSPWGHKESDTTENTHTCGILVPQPEIQPARPALEDGFLTTEPPGKSLTVFFPDNLF